MYHDEPQYPYLLPPVCTLRSSPSPGRFLPTYVRDPLWARFMCARFRKCNVFHFMIYPRTKSAFLSSPRSSPPCPPSPRRKTPFPLPLFVVHVLVTFALLLLLYPSPCRCFVARAIFRTGFVVSLITCTPA